MSAAQTVTCLPLGRRMAFRGILLAGLSVPCPGVANEPPAQPGPPPPDVRRLLDQLGSPRHADREAATRRLMADESARPFVEARARSPDAEVAVRAKQILAEYDKRIAASSLARYLRYGKDGQVERMVEGLARWRGPIQSEEFWRGIEDCVLTLRAEGRVSVHRGLPRDLVGTFQAKQITPHYLRPSDPLTGHLHLCLVASETQPVRARIIAAGIIVAASGVSTEDRATQAVILTNDDFVCGEGRSGAIEGCVIISSGRVALGSRVEDSLVISRGGIGAANLKDISHCHLASSGKIAGLPNPDKWAPIVEAEQGKPLGFVRWFETSAVGLEATPVRGGMRVTKVAEDSVAGRAGLRVGDVISALDGEAAKDTPDGFRKQVRRGSVQDACVLTVTRDGTARPVTLDFRTETGK